MSKFRKLPVEIEAVRVADALRAASLAWADLPKWLADAYEVGGVLFLPNAVEIVTLEGIMTGQRADWIIRGVQGELYPCKPDIFEATYEPADQPPAPPAESADGEPGPVPPAAHGLPAGALASAQAGAAQLDAWARTPYGANVLAHALVGLQRDGFLLQGDAPPAGPTEAQRHAERLILQYAKNIPFSGIVKSLEGIAGWDDLAGEQQARMVAEIDRLIGIATVAASVSWPEPADTPKES